MASATERESHVDRDPNAMKDNAGSQSESDTGKVRGVIRDPGAKGKKSKLASWLKCWGKPQPDTEDRGEFARLLRSLEQSMHQKFHRGHIPEHYHLGSKLQYFNNLTICETGRLDGYT